MTWLSDGCYFKQAGCLKALGGESDPRERSSTTAKVAAANCRPSERSAEAVVSGEFSNPSIFRSWMSEGRVLMQAIGSISQAESLVGQELGVGDWVVIDQKRINRFADVTGDHQWIHVDVEQARNRKPLRLTDRARVSHAVAGAGPEQDNFRLGVPSWRSTTGSTKFDSWHRCRWTVASRSARSWPRLPSSTTTQLI